MRFFRFQPFLEQQGNIKNSFISFFQINQKFISHFVEYYEHGKLLFILF